MATAEEILAGMTAEETQQVLVIDNDLRRITIPEGVRLLGVTSDDDVLRLRFTMPRVYGEVDLSGFAIRINYLNAGSEGDVYPVDDAQTDGDVIRFTWLVGRHACKFAGDVRFIVCLKRSEGGEVAQEYNTTLATLPVLEGLEPGEAVAQAHPDVIEAILKRLDTLEQEGGGVSTEAIAAAVEAYIQEHGVQVEEVDPTVPDWAKQPSKPTYTAGEVGARPDTWTPSASDVGARPDTWTPSASDVGARPDTWMPSAADVGADAAGTASGAVAAHNVSGAAHADLRALIEGLNSRLNALADSDDTTLDQLSEIVAYIKSNRTLIDAVTTGKVSVSDIVDNLTTNASGKVLSAAQGVALKAMIDGIVIPDKLPNPQPITINGQRYDGSEAVTVTVSSEGGGTPVEIDDTLTQSGKAADAKTVGDRLSALNQANARQDERLTTLENSSGIVTVEPADGDVPLLFYGAALPQTKTDTAMPISYASKTLKRDDANAETKAQGTSSLSYPKKNQTTKFSEAINFKGWGLQKKYCMKANWIDLTHARNIVSAQLWGDVVKSRANYLDLPELLRTSPNQGAVDGFPALVYADGVYQGRYTINIPKDGWMANMDKTLDNHCILCGENYVSGCFRATANINGSDWSDELHDTVPAAIKTRWNEIINFVMTATDDEFVAGIGNYFYLDSLIDYYIFGVVSCGLDAFGKNQIYMTYDGQKWIASMYDMDSTWGLWWNGSSFVATDYARTEFQDFKDGQGNLLYIRLEDLFYEQIQARWAELKDSVLSYANIMTRFERFIGIVPPHIVKEDYASTTGGGKFTGIPSQATNHIQQIRAYVAARLPYADEWFASLTPVEKIPCTGITLDQTTLTFTASGTQTLTATVTPSDTTDTVVWSSDAPSIASVSGGVVTAKANGSATITAACGAYSATCTVSVSGIGSGSDDEGVDYTLDALADVTWTSGQTYDASTGLIKSVSDEHTTSKFTAQDCLYEVASTDANNKYVCLFTFDESDNILWTKEWATLSGKEVVQLKPGYKYALKTYNTGTFNEDSLTLTPLDNRETMGAEVTIDFTNLSESDITYNSGSKSFEISITDRCGGLITAGGGVPNYSKVNRFSVQLYVKGYSNNQEPKLPNTMQESCPICWRLHAWQSNVHLVGYSNRITSAADMVTYLREKNVKVVLNGAPTN